MIQYFFLLLLCGHILGDFYLQTNSMSEKKEQSVKWVFLHGLLFLGSLLFVILPVYTVKFLLIALLAAVLHLLIDLIKYLYLSAKTKKNKRTYQLERNVFFLDQCFHGISLFILSYWMYKQQMELTVNWNLNQFFEIFQTSFIKILPWIVALLILHKPANICIQKILLVYRPENKDGDVKVDNKAGRIIGTLERMIMLIFLSLGQYSALGFILTAKSIARYDRISKERDFAEYYLLGTLLSTLIVILVSFLVQ